MPDAPPTLPETERRGLSRHAQLRRALFRILGALDDTRPTGLMRVVAAEQEVGRLAVAGGRLCLAFATPAGAALEERDDAHGPAAGLRELCELAAAARKSGASLCAAVLNSGRETALREALLEETARSLVAIASACGAGALPALELTSARDDYDGRLLLGTSEVFLAALRAHLGVPQDAVALAWEGMQPDDAALLLVRSPEPQEQPYPVAERGFGEGGLRHVVALTRLASALERASARPESAAPGLAPPAPVSGASLRWRCVTGHRRIVLLRARATTLESATARALRFVEFEGDRRGVEIHDADEATLAAAGLPASPGGEASGASAGSTPQRPWLPPVDVAGGMIWPPDAAGRALLREALAEAAPLAPLADGGWAAVTPGRFWLHSRATDLFLSAETAHAALLHWARWHAEAQGRLSPRRCIVVAQSGDATWRLWQAVHVHGTLRQELERVLALPQPDQVALGLIATSRAFAEGLTACASLGVPGSIETLGSAAGGSVYMGLAPPADTPPTALDADALRIDECLRAEFGPLLAARAADPRFDVPRVLHELLPLASVAGQARAGEILAVLLIGS